MKEGGRRGEGEGKERGRRGEGTYKRKGEEGFMNYGSKHIANSVKEVKLESKG